MVSEKVNRVAIISDNSPCCVNAILESWNQGYSVMMIDFHLPKKYTMEVIKSSRVKKCYIDSAFCDKFVELKSSIQIEVLDACISPCLICKEDYEDLYNVSYKKEEALVLFSSGTSGNRKGICLTHYAINKNADSIIDYLKNTEDDIFYIVKSINHSSTIIGEMLVAIKKKSKMLFSPTMISMNMIKKNILNYGITILGVNPLLLKYISGFEEYGKLQNVYCSGAGIPRDVWEEIKEKMQGVNIYNAYGLTEAGPRVCSQGVSGHGNSVGKPIKGVQIKIVEHTGQKVTRGGVGLVYVKTESRFTRYLNSKLENSEWINTKDIGYVDEYGELNIIGRSDNMIQVNSHNVYPEVIEDIICDEIDILDCIVRKEIDRNTTREQLVCLYLANTEKDIKEIIRKLRNVLTPYELPATVYKVEGGFYNSNGKKDRTKRREDYEK